MTQVMFTRRRQQAGFPAFLRQNCQKIARMRAPSHGFAPAAYSPAVAGLHRASLSRPALLLLILSLFLLLTPAKPVRADHRFDLHDVNLYVVDESDAERQRAFARGLREVFVRLSGDSLIATRLKLPAPASYVKQYSYQPVEQTQINEEGEVLNYRLTVQYNGTRVVEYLRDNGLPVWGEHRPKLVVWIAVRDGRREYVLKKSDDSLIKTAVESALERRGIPSGWPLYDRQDSRLLSFADIRGGFREPLEKASARYARGPVLSASLSWNGQLWQTRWTLLLNKTEYRWSNKGRNYNTIISQTIDQVVDTMGKVYAIRERADGEKAETVTLNIRDVSTITDYRRVSEYLAAMPAVKLARITLADGQQVEFDLLLRSGRADFLKLLKNDGELLEVKVKPKKTAPVPHAPAVLTGPPGAASADISTPAPAPANPVATASDSPTASARQSLVSNLSHASAPAGEPEAASGQMPVAAAKTIYYFRLSK